MHMRFRYNFLADLHITRHACETESEKCIRNTLNKACRGELVTSRIRDYRLKPYESTHFFIYGWEFTDGFVLGKPDIDKYFQIQTSVEVRNDSNHYRRFKVEKAWFFKYMYNNYLLFFTVFHVAMVLTQRRRGRRRWNVNLLSAMFL